MLGPHPTAAGAAALLRRRRTILGNGYNWQERCAEGEHSDKGTEG